MAKYKFHANFKIWSEEEVEIKARDFDEACLKANDYLWDKFGATDIILVEDTQDDR